MSEHKPFIFSYYDNDIVTILTDIKTEIDQKVYDRNDILKKDEYFEMTVYDGDSPSSGSLSYA